MKADLHVHSYHSGHARHFGWIHARDSYSSPEAIYRVAKARGMDLVCITDHDSIDGCREFLDRHPGAPDFIVGEEVECLVPDAPGLRIHLGVIDLNERIHDDVQRLKKNVFETAAYLREQQVFFVLNHLFFLFGDQMPVRQYVRQAMALAPGIETHNGAMLASHNQFIADLVEAFQATGGVFSAIGGSDAHTLQWVGTAYTEAAASTREEYLAMLRTGKTQPGGSHGDVRRLLAEIYGVVINHWRSLLGFERHDVVGAQRLTAVICSALLLPFQFVPGMVALTMKGNERRRLDRYRHAWHADDVRAAAPRPSTV